MNFKRSKKCYGMNARGHDGALSELSATEKKVAPRNKKRKGRGETKEVRLEKRVEESQVSSATSEGPFINNLFINT